MTDEEIRATGKALEVGVRRTNWIIRLESQTTPLAMMLAMAYCQGIKDCVGMQANRFPEPVELEL